MTSPESILFLCAHNDDQIIGGGGTIAKYAKEGKKIYTVIFSFGETSLPHYTEQESKVTRVLESKKAAKVLGETETYYLGLKEGNFEREINEKQISDKIDIIIKRIRPSKIFTHSIDDPHPDHREVYNFTENLIESINYKGEVYSYNVWNLFLNFRKRNFPKLVVDITDSFHIKLEALKQHKSQFLARMSLTWSVYVQAIMNGFDNQMRFAEIFYKIR
jgi:N-acetylglucosamine malate deacetylase 1